MKEEIIQDLLAAHAEALNRGEQHAAWLARQRSVPLDALPLLNTAYLLQQALTPVRVPDPLYRRLRKELLAADSTSHSRMLLGAAAVGSALSLAGLYFYWQRRRGPLPWDEHLDLIS